MNDNKLIFVYNADSSLFDQVSDFAKKIITPDEYECNLCKMTYGNLTQKKMWKDFLKSLKYEKKFYHRDKFRIEFPQEKDIALPAIYLLQDKKLEPLLSAEDINGAEDLKELIKILDNKLKQSHESV